MWPKFFFSLSLHDPFQEPSADLEVLNRKAIQETHGQVTQTRQYVLALWMLNPLYGNGEDSAEVQTAKARGYHTLEDNGIIGGVISMSVQLGSFSVCSLKWVDFWDRGRGKSAVGQVSLRGGGVSTQG